MIPESAVLASLGDPAVALAVSGEVLCWPPGASRLFGYAAHELQGRRLAELPLDWPQKLQAGESRVTLRRRDGRRFAAALTVTSLPGTAGEPEGTVVVVKDLEPWIGPGGEADPPSEGLDIDERLGAAFRGVMEATGADLDPGETLDQLAHRLALQGHRLLPEVECMIAEVLADRRNVFRCQGAAGPFAERLVGRIYPLAGSIAGRALAAEQAQESTRMDQEGADPDLLGEAGMHTLRAVPLLTRQPLPDGRRAVGVLTVLRRAPVAFSADERRLIDDFGRLISLSIQRAELRLAADRSMERLQLAVDVALDLAQSLDVRNVVRQLVRRVALGTRADRCVLLRVEAAETVVEDAFDVAGYEDLPGYRQPVAAQQLMARAVSTHAPGLGGRYDLSAMPPVLREALAGVRHTATVPLLHGGDVVAILVLSRRGDPAFGREDLEALRLLGGPAALALRNSFLYAQTEEASRVKSDFLDMAAHELRAPLTVIAGYLSMLREDTLGPLPPSWLEPLRTLEHKVGELNRLVEDLLMGARLDTGRLNSTITAVDLVAAAEKVAGDGGPETMVTADGPVLVHADRAHVTRIVQHLVANALAYGRAGEAPWVRIRVDADLDRGEGRLTVEDRGRGLAREAAGRIFERFQRIEDLDHPAVPGTGLGLYIARELALRYGGRLELEWTEPGRGSRFALHLQLAFANGPEEAK